MSALLHMCRRFIEKQVNGSKVPFKFLRMSGTLSSPPIPHRLLTAYLRQVNAILLVRTDILDEEINGPCPRAIFSRINQLVSFNPPYSSLYRIARAVEAISVERLHCGLNAQRRTAMDNSWRYKLTVLY